MADDVAFKSFEPYSKQLDTYLQQIKEFNLSWKEWASKNRQPICRVGVMNGVGANNLYTIPENFNFFLTSFSMNAVSDGTGLGALTYAVFGVNNADLSFGVVGFRDNLAHANSQNSTFPNPIKITSGSQMVLQNLTAHLCSSCMLSGWLEPK